MTGSKHKLQITKTPRSVKLKVHALQTDHLGTDESTQVLDLEQKSPSPRHTHATCSLDCSVAHKTPRQ